MIPDHTADATTILRAAIAAADPAELVRLALHDAPEFVTARTVHLIAVGKAAGRMTEGAVAVLRDRIVTQLIVVPHGVSCANALHAAHPIPDESSVAAADAVLTTITAAPHSEPLLVLLSGGASALIAHPAGNITIHEYAECVRLLNRAGASIAELNTVRKHIDSLKGGRLAALAAPRRVLGLILSDVVGDRVDVIASGPLSPDPTTFADAIRVLRVHNLWAACAASIRAQLLRLGREPSAETPKDESALANARTAIVGSNALARAGAIAAARSLGYHTIEAAEPVTGEARVAGRQLAQQARSLLPQLMASAAPLCIVAGGETTVTVRGSGRGGRNQELVLAAALALEDVPHITVGSIGTDGIDGDSDAAGALASAQLLGLARSRGLSPEKDLENNDSYGFFSRAGGLITTGATGTNVMDVQVLLLQHQA